MEEYDTDSISLASTAASSPRQEYEVDDVISEDYLDDEDETKVYLIKWTGYEMHRCQWEPLKDSPEVVENWEAKKRRIELGLVEPYKSVQEYCRVNRRAFEKACETYERIKESRHAKRAKKRQQVEQQLPLSGGATQENQSSSNEDDDLPLRGRYRSQLNSHTQRRKSRIILSSDDESDGDRSRSDQGPTAKTSEQQSKSKGAAERSDSLVKEQVRDKRTTRDIQSKEIQSPRFDTAQKGDREPEERRKDSYTEITPELNALSTRKEVDDTAPLSTQSEGNSLSAASHISNKAAAFPQQQELQQATRTVLSKSSARIKMINASVKEKRKEWKHGDGHFKKAHFMRKAELRGRDEGMPDVSVLQFVNDTDGTFPRSTVSAPNGFDLRDSPPRRLQEIPHHQEDSCPEPPDYEKGKIQLTCFEWKNGQCPFSSEQCRYLHRVTEQNSTVDGIIPPKHLRKPLTCYFWFTSSTGCTRGDDCSFAHENTGTLGFPDRKPPMAIDQKEEPNFMKFAPTRRASDQWVPDTKSLTCYFWATHGFCNRRESSCKFAHRHTGQVAEPPGFFKKMAGFSLNPDANTAADNHNALDQPMESQQDYISPITTIETSLIRHDPEFGPLEIRVSLSGIDQATLVWIDSVINARHGLLIDRVCYPSCWKAWICEPHGILKTGELAVGEVLADQSSPSASDELFKLQDNLDIWKMGAVVLDESFTMIVFPAQCQYWDFSNGRLKGSSTFSGLRFHLLRVPLIDHSPRTDAVSDNMPNFQIEIAKSLHAHMDKLFTRNQSSLQRRAFLMFHPDKHRELLELLETWLLMEKVEIFHLGIVGSWDCFVRLVQEGTSGCILVHPDMHSFQELLNFGKILIKNIPVFLVREPALHMTRIFPHGGVIYITDEVFEKEPHKALDIWKNFEQRVKYIEKLDGILLWRLATRPGLLSFLQQLLEKYASAIEAGDGKKACLLELYKRILGQVEEEDQMDEDLPHDYYPIMSLHPKDLKEFFRRKDLGDHVGANECMIEHYAAWVVHQKLKYRSVVVVHTQYADVRQKYQNVEEFMTPRQCIEYFKAHPTGNRFEFYERKFGSAKPS